MLGDAAHVMPPFTGKGVNLALLDALELAEALTDEPDRDVTASIADFERGIAAVLLQEGRFEGPTPPLTASEALDLDDVAAILADFNGRPVQRRVISDEEQAARMAQRGVRPIAVAMTLGLYRAARSGEFAAVDPTLATLLGREPMTLRAVLAAGSDA